MSSIFHVSLGSTWIFCFDLVGQPASDNPIFPQTVHAQSLDSMQIVGQIKFSPMEDDVADLDMQEDLPGNQNPSYDTETKELGGMECNQEQPVRVAEDSTIK